MIVKDEEAMLGRCLDSVKWADEVIVLDTGSTDGTGAVARRYPNVRYIDGEYKWEDSFCKARNKALSYATGDWVFSIDADEFLEEGSEPKVRDVMRQFPDFKAVAVRVINNDGAQELIFPRMFKRTPEHYWKGDVHNTPEPPPDAAFDIRILSDYSPTHDKDPLRAFRMLKAAMEKNPKAVREAFYLAREYAYLNDWENAVKWYEDYLTRAEYVPEIVEALLQLSKGYFYMGDKEKAADYCLKCIGINADFRAALIWMAYISGPKNKDRWLEFSETAQDNGTLFTAKYGGMSSHYYDGMFACSQDMSRYLNLYRKVGEMCNGDKVLDIGCGLAELRKYVSNYHGFDFSDKAVEIAADERVRKGDAYDRKNYEGDYTTYTATEVLEHLDDRRLVEMVRPGARFIFTVPSFPDPSHVRLYTEKVIKRRLGEYLDIKGITRFNFRDGKWEEGGTDTNDYILLVDSRRKEATGGADHGR